MLPGPAVHGKKHVATRDAKFGIPEHPERPGLLADYPRPRLVSG